MRGHSAEHAQRVNELIQPSADRRVADAEFGFHFLQIAAASDERPQEVELVLWQPRKLVRRKLAGQLRATASATQVCDRQMPATHGALGDQLVETSCLVRRHTQTIPPGLRIVKPRIKDFKPDIPNCGIGGTYLQYFRTML